MKALRTDAFLVVINGQGTIVVKHSDGFAANDAVPAPASFTKSPGRRPGPEDNRNQLAADVEAGALFELKIDGEGNWKLVKAKVLFGKAAQKEQGW